MTETGLASLTETGPASHGTRRLFAIVSDARLPRQLLLTLPPGSSPGRRRAAAAAAPRPRRSTPSARPHRSAPLPAPASSASPRRTGGSTVDDLVAAMQASIEAQGRRPAPAETSVRRATTEEWLSPTKMGLRYGEVCIAQTPDGAAALVRITSYRAPVSRPAGKRPYRRWHGIDLLAFLATGTRRELRIAQVLKGSRC